MWIDSCRQILPLKKTIFIEKGTLTDIHCSVLVVQIALRNSRNPNFVLKLRSRTFGDSPMERKLGGTMREDAVISQLEG